MSIGDRVDEAYVKLGSDDLENSLIQLSIAIDATAKRKFKKEKKVGRRIKKFVDEYEDLIIHFSMAGQLRIFARDGIVYGKKGSLGNVVYKSIRCALLHEADISDQVVFKKGTVLGMDNGKFIVTDQFLWGLILILVGDKININQRFKIPREMIFNGVRLKLNDCWGNIEHIKTSTKYVSSNEF